MPGKPQTVRLKKSSLGLRLGGEKAAISLLRQLKLDASVPPVSQFFRGGTSEAEKIFRKFLRTKFAGYGEHRNQPQTTDVSHMSKYLHFGQISPGWQARAARKQKAAGRENIRSFVDELLVRRELAINFCHFNERYDCYDALRSGRRPR